jgi:hypothetical protein
MQPDDEMDEGGISNEADQYNWQEVQSRKQAFALKTNEESDHERDGGGQQVMGHDQPLPWRQPWQLNHDVPVDGAMPVSIPAFRSMRHPAPAS